MQRKAKKRSWQYRYPGIKWVTEAQLCPCLSRPGVGFSPLPRSFRTRTFLPLPKVQPAGLLALTNHITLPRCCQNSTVFPLANPASVPKPTRKKGSSKWWLFLKVFKDTLFPFWMNVGSRGMSSSYSFLHSRLPSPFSTRSLLYFCMFFLLVFITTPTLIPIPLYAAILMWSICVL